MFKTSGYKPKLFDPKSSEAFKLSRSKIDLFLECPRCFYMDRRLGVARPQGFPFNLNSAVDLLLKKEFDGYRKSAVAHPLMVSFGIDALPYQHPDLETWRENFTGVRYMHRPSNFLVFGAVDDLWVKPDGSLIVVDYKATSKDTEVNLDAEWQIGYKRQVEVYQWLLRQNGFQVADETVFVYCNGRRDPEGFNARLDFDIKLITYIGSATWIEQALHDARACLLGELPTSNPGCEYCAYRKSASNFEAQPQPPAYTIPVEKPTQVPRKLNTRKIAVEDPGQLPLL